MLAALLPLGAAPRRVLRPESRRVLTEDDSKYGLFEFNSKFNSKARHLFTDPENAEHHFHRRLFEHEDALPADALQTYVASLHTAVTPALTQSLEARAALKVHTVVGGDLLLHGTREHADALREQPEVRVVVPLLPELKLSPHFDELLPSAEAIAAARNGVALTIRMVPLAEVLAALPEALWVEPQPTYRMLNAEAAAITQSGSTPIGGGVPVGTKPIWLMGIHGEDEIIGVGDSGLDAGHCFFENAQGDTAAGQAFGPTHRKILNYRAYADGEATGLRDHGTHVTGSILGESSTPGVEGSTETGTAYKAKVTFTDIGPGDAPGLAVPNDLVNNFFNVDYELGAKIHTNSWGANVNAYTVPTQDVDEFMHVNNDMLILFAAGNSGQEGPGSIGAPATCKNCLSVGASENNNPPQRQDGNVALFSSQGPSLGRFKPDVVAPGFSVLSANSNSAGDCPLTPMAGTSMATPVTAGDVALVRQYLREGYFPTGVKGGGPSKLASGALLKALVVHSGVALTGTYQGAPLTPPPSNIQGFGRVQLNRILFSDAAQANNTGKSPGDRLFFVDDAARPLNPSETHTYTVTLSPTPDPLLKSELKVTLVWTDPPAEPLADNPLINNLDLSVEVGGLVQQGNGVLDAANTVEQVIIPTATGVATISVTGTAITQGQQKYALVVTGPLAIESPPPASPGPPPPNPPAPPGLGGDAMAIGVTVPLLLLAVLAGGCFLCRRRGGGGKGGAAAAGVAGTTTLLPPGWKQMKDPNTGAPYYYNEKDGSTSWEPPPMEKPAPPPSAAVYAADTLPAPWTAVADPATQRTYYYNTATGETMWTRPVG